MAVAGALTAGAPAAHAAAAEQCGELAFNAGTTLSASNYGAGEITALRTNCAVARMGVPSPPYRRASETTQPACALQCC